MERVTYDLPSCWSWVPLGKVATLLNGRAYKQAELLESGPTPVLRVGNFFSNRSWYYSDLKLPEDKYCDEGDLLYAWSASFGPKIWEGPRAIYHYHIWKILTSPEIDKKFLFYLLEKDSEDIKSQGNGVGMFHATKGGMEKMSVPLPPVSEQKRIIEKLDALFNRIDTAIEHLQESVALSDALYASYVDKLLKPSETEDGFNSTSFLNSTWEWKSIEDVFSITSGKNLTQKDMIHEGIYPVYGGNGITGRHNDFNLDGINIIIGRVGALCGNVRLISEKIWVTDNAFFVKEYKVEISKEFLAKVLDALNLGATANKAAQPVISYKGIKDLSIPCPPLEEQEEIVKKLNILSEKQKDNRELLLGKIGRLRLLRKSILDSAFRGEL
ncbi:restriction endonuclease subunit S [Pseudomonas sp. BF-RE-26]|uniref:restriction endonuclease subunit S n=1 Tax=Pseudomonas sp. BF-RE-26 TaxID=2832396 RepID=UPI001CBD0946|nr:restriction endonuclease subunit S [Pseudomonas sp. BF-RE-26]